MRAAPVVVGWVLAWSGCTAPAQALPPPAAPAPAAHTTLAEEDSYKPTYGKAELSRALIAERGAEATLERRVGELEAKRDAMPGTAFDPAVEDQLRVATADLAVRRRFIASLEVCESAGRWCPPRLDDPPWAYDPDPDPPAQASEPPLSAPLRFDLDSWRTVAAELYGRACACRTIACVDSVGVAIDELEPRAMPAVSSATTRPPPTSPAPASACSGCAADRCARPPPWRLRPPTTDPPVHDRRCRAGR
jgi:hypothetical protein